MNFSKRYQQKNLAKQRGIVLVIAVLLLLVGALAAIISLTTSRQNIRFSGIVYGKRAAVYSTEEAINRTLSKVRLASPYSDDPSETTKLFGTFDSANDDPATLTNCEGLYTWTSADHATGGSNPVEPGKIIDSGKMVCNFLGSEANNARVSIRRDKNFVDASSGNVAGVFLVSVIVKDDKGIVSKKQAVILQPLSPISLHAYAPDPNFLPFLGTTTTPR
jgi:Tfp pilus assembly protein PilX